MQRDSRPGSNTGGTPDTSKLDAIENLIEPTIDAMGYGLVRVMLSGGKHHPVLQIMVERSDDKSMTVEGCAEISRAVSALLDVADPIASAYQLEVSSPGIDRPLVKQRDFERFAGEVAKLETGAPVEGRKRFQGRLLGVANGAVRIKLDEGTEVAVPLDAVTRAKLVLTDELLRAHLARQGQDSEQEQATN